MQQSSTMADPSLNKSITSTSPVRAVAGTLALSGFAVAVLGGWQAGNPIDVIVIRALVSLCFCLLVGMLAGRFCLIAVSEHLHAYITDRPVPNSNIEVEDLALEIRTKREQQHPTQKILNN